jgi:hypothetical protein
MVARRKGLHVLKSAGGKGAANRTVGAVRDAKHRLAARFPPLAFPVRRFVRATSALRSQVSMGDFPIVLDYPVSPRARYGWGLPPHAAIYDLINVTRDAYFGIVGDLERFAVELRAIPLEADVDATVPCWSSTWLQGLDAITLYVFPALFKPSLYLEIGSGNSTKFVRRSIVDHGLSTQIVSIDPVPRAEVGSLCDRSIRQPLETVDLGIFDSLRSDDILMIDGSHRCFQNSDATIFFLDILPRLKSGVLVFIHDIFLPYDYRPEWVGRWYSEQYLLGVLLLNDRGRRYDILFPGLFVDRDDALRARAESMWAAVGHEAPLPNGATGFWMRVKDAPAQ